MESIGKEVYVNGATNTWRFAVIIKVEGSNYTVRYKDDTTGVADIVNVSNIFPLFSHATTILNHFDRIDMVSAGKNSAIFPSDKESAAVIAPLTSALPVKKNTLKNQNKPRYAEIVLKMNEEMLKLKTKVDRIISDLDDEKSNELNFDALAKICGDADKVGGHSRDSPCSFSSMFSSSNFSYYEQDVIPKVIKKRKIDMHEDYCHICNDGGDLICCDYCPLVYHVRCAKLRKAPVGNWKCIVCQGGVKKKLSDEISL